MNYFCYDFFSHIKLYFLCGMRTIISVGFQPNSEDVVRPRTREEYEYQRQKNYKPPRYTALTRRNVQSVKKQKIINKCFARVFQASTAAHT